MDKEVLYLDDSEPGAAEVISVPPLLSEQTRSFCKLPSTLTPPSDENIPGPPTEGNRSDALSEEATVEIWSGDDSSLRNMLIASLRENQIGVRQENTGGKSSLFVAAEDEKRAREIVREIVEGAPPQ